MGCFELTRHIYQLSISSGVDALTPYGNWHIETVRSSVDARDKGLSSA